MDRIDLQVPFSEKDEAKRLGARWDIDKKVWYIPDGTDAMLFQKWLPEEIVINVRSPYYGIATSTKACWRCGKTTQVFGFMLPPGHETLEETESDDGTLEWVKGEEETAILYVSYIPDAVKNQMKKISTNFRLDFSKKTQSSYLMNHCEHCGIKQGDFNLYCEPNGGFCPMTEEDYERITVQMIDEPFEANCGGRSIDGVVIT
jgi:hypothetical protein